MRPGVGDLSAWLVRVAGRAPDCDQRGGFRGAPSPPVSWAEKRQAIYTQMAEHVAAHVDLEPVRRSLGL